MRNEMIGAIVRRAIEHPEFRERLIEDPQTTLSNHGFALEADDMDELERVRTEMGEGSHQDAEQRLISIAERYGVEPEPRR